MVISSDEDSRPSEVPNPEYAYWAQHPAGSTVMILKEATIYTPAEDSFTGEEHTSFQKTWVVWRIDQVSRLGVRISGESGIFPSEGEMQKLYPQTETIHAYLPPEKIVALEEAGTETVTVPAGTFICRKTRRTVEEKTWDFVLRSEVTSWWSDEIPGGLVKTTVESEDQSVKVLRQVTEFEVPRRGRFDG